MQLRQHVAGLLRARSFASRFDPRIPQLAGGRAPLWHWSAWRADPVGTLGKAVALSDAAVVRIAYDPVIIFNSPQAYEDVLIKQPEGFERGPLSGTTLRGFLGANVLTSNGPEWERHRQMAQPSFHPKVIDRMLSDLVVEAGELLDGWQEHAQSGSVIDLARESMRLTASISAAAFLGLRLSSEESQLLADAIVTTQRWVFASMSAMIPSRMPAAVQAGLELMERLVQRAIDLPPPLTGSPHYLERVRQDASFSRQAARDQAMLILTAAPENPSNMLAWAAWLLARNPEWEASLRAEVERVLGKTAPSLEVLDDMPILDRVLSEVMRLYPGAWLFDRQARVDHEIAGVRVPAGATLLFAPYYLHRNPRYWSDPERFDPDRFLPERVAERHRLAFLPFGAGPRVCIAARLALLEVKLLLVQLFQRFRVEPSSGEQLVVEGLFALRARDGVKVRLRSVA